MMESCPPQPKQTTSPSEVFEEAVDITFICEDLIRNAFLLPVTTDELEKSMEYIEYTSAKISNFSRRDNIGDIDTGIRKANFYFNVSDDSGDDFI